MPVFVKVSVVQSYHVKYHDSQYIVLQCVSVSVMQTVVYTMTLLDLASVCVPITHKVLCVKNVWLDSTGILQCSSQILA